MVRISPHTMTETTEDTTHNNQPNSQCSSDEAQNPNDITNIEQQNNEKNVAECTNDTNKDKTTNDVTVTISVPEEIYQTNLNVDQTTKIPNPSLPGPSAENVSPREQSVSPNCSSCGEICRICHCEAEADAPLISPCICSGSLKFVHQSCLQQWIKSSDARHCELCKFEFVMKVTTKPFSDWKFLSMSSLERRKIICSVSFHTVALTCVIWALYVLIERTTEEINHGELDWPFWTKLIVVAVGFTGGVVFMYVQCRMYSGLCKRWRSFNRIFLVQNIPPDMLEKSQKEAKEKLMALQYASSAHVTSTQTGGGQTQTLSVLPVIIVPTVTSSNCSLQITPVAAPEFTPSDPANDQASRNC